MAKSASEGYINHYNSVRLRAKGSASLKMRLLSLDEIKTTTLLPLTIISVNNIELTRKANFQQQRAQLEIKTIAIDETFIISKIIIFAKPIAEAYPG
jgi:hypothetical protein